MFLQDQLLSVKWTFFKGIAEQKKNRFKWPLGVIPTNERK